MDLAQRWRRHPSHFASLTSVERFWVKVRLVGWVLLGLWPTLSLVSEFYPLPLEADVIRITGKALGLAGLVCVALGFERLMHVAAQRRAMRKV